MRFPGPLHNVKIDSTDIFSNSRRDPVHLTGSGRAGVDQTSSKLETNDQDATMS